jgi:hypothetical protein
MITAYAAEPLEVDLVEERFLDRAGLRSLRTSIIVRGRMLVPDLAQHQPLAGAVQRASCHSAPDESFPVRFR